jgi:hypothetical protein
LPDDIYPSYLLTRYRCTYRPAACLKSHLVVHGTAIAAYRLVNSEDQSYLKAMLHDLLKSKFECREEYEEFFVKHTLMFGDYMRMGAPREERVYEEVGQGICAGPWWPCLPCLPSLTTQEH